MRSVTNYMERKSIARQLEDDGVGFDFEQEIKNNTITINDQFEVIGNTYKYKDLLKLEYGAKWNPVAKVWALTKENANLIYRMVGMLEKVVK